MPIPADIEQKPRNIAPRLLSYVRMANLGDSLVGAALGIVGLLALTATGASAAIVCKEEGDCWHVNEKYDYRPEFGLHIYGDDWKWADTDSQKYRWREHEGRGYWRKGVWVEIP